MKRWFWRVSAMRRMVLLRRLAGDRSGNFGILSAFLLVAMLGMAGMAVNLAGALNLKASLQQAADAAVLEAISLPARRDAIAANLSPAAEKQRMVSVFLEQAGKFAGGTAVSATGSIDRQGNTVSARLQFSARAPANLLAVVGIDHYDVSGQSKASVAGAFLDLHVLIDNSSSMAIPTSYTEIDRMVAAVADAAKGDPTIIDRRGCAYACHDTRSPAEGGLNYYAIAKRIGIPLRLDAAKQGAQQIAATATSLRVHPRQFRLSLYTLGQRMEELFGKPLTQDLAPTADLAAFSRAVADVMPIMVTGDNQEGSAGTYLRQALERLQASIPQAGDGTSEGAPRQVVLLVSDGLADSYMPDGGCATPDWWGRCIEPLDNRLCDILKARGVTVAVIHLPFYAEPDLPFYRLTIQPFEQKLQDNMEACASPGFYRQVDFGGDISSSMNELFQVALGIPRLEM